MQDHNGNVWVTEPVDKRHRIFCTTKMHDGLGKRSSFKEILRYAAGNVRVEYTCIPCHLALLVAAKSVVG